MSSERIQRRVERLLDQIEEAMDRLDWDSVRSCAQAVLALDANNNEGVAFLAAAERATGGYSHLGFSFDAGTVGKSGN